jgi:hypothetical protein
VNNVKESLLRVPSKSDRVANSPHTWIERSHTVNPSSNFSFTLDGPAIIRSIWIELDHDGLWDDVFLSVRWDRKRTPADQINMELSQLFGSPSGSLSTGSVYLHGMHSTYFETPGAFSLFPMPFFESAEFNFFFNPDYLKNHHNRSLDVLITVSIELEKTQLDPESGYFYAKSRMSRMLKFKRAFEIASFDGWGHFVGHLFWIYQRRVTDMIHEGDFLIYTDGTRSPLMHNTGTEDYYFAAHLFRYEPDSHDLNCGFSRPLYGCPKRELEGVYHMPYCVQNYVPSSTREDIFTYRWQIGDAISFKSGFSFYLMRGEFNSAAARLSGTSFFYGREGESKLLSLAKLVIGDANAEVEYDYRASGKTENYPGLRWEASKDIRTEPCPRGECSPFAYKVTQRVPTQVMTFGDHASVRCHSLLIPAHVNVSQGIRLRHTILDNESPLAAELFLTDDELIAPHMVSRPYLLLRATYLGLFNWMDRNKITPLVQHWFVAKPRRIDYAKPRLHLCVPPRFFWNDVAFEFFQY